LTGLPNGHLLGAVSARGAELRTIATARLVAPFALDAVAEADLLKDNDPTRMLGTFDAVRRQLTGVQMALYATGATTASEVSDRGMMAGLFVLETADPTQLVESIAAEGITLGGAARAENDANAPPPIVLRRHTGRETVAGHAVDHLEIDTSSLAAETAAALREAFGPAWMIVRAAPLENQVVLLLGSERGLFEETLQGMDSRSKVLSGSRPFAETRTRIDAAHQAALYVSLARTLPAAAGFEDGAASLVREVDRISSAALTVERDLLQVEFWLPLAEIKAIPKEWFRLWW
jgi:hypothetical protein